MHTEQLLCEEDLFVVEDLVADFIALQTSSAGGILTEQILTSMSSSASTLVEEVKRLVGLSEAIVNDVAFARQVRRRVRVLSSRML
eukprot:SAG31_NODE_25592_length_458_cov_1.133705_1_plen_86_part_00